MLADLGDNIDIGPEKFDFKKYSNIFTDADAVVVVNSPTNLNGTPLMEYVFKISPNSLHFLDPADIDTRKKEFLESLRQMESHYPDQQIIEILPPTKPKVTVGPNPVGCN